MNHEEHKEHKEEREGRECAEPKRFLSRQREVPVDPEECARIIVDAAVKVHRALGPGLLESAYQQCLAFELGARGLRVACEVQLPISYGGLHIDAGYRLDMLVEDCVIIENKTVERLLPLHEAQLLTYLRLKGRRIGFLLNWNVLLMKDGIKRMVNDSEPPGRGRGERRQSGS